MAVGKSLINEMRTRVVVYRKQRETAADGQSVASTLQLVGSALAKAEAVSIGGEAFLGDVHSVPRAYRLTMWRFPVRVDDVIEIPEFDVQLEVAQVVEDTRTITVTAVERSHD